MKDSFPSRICLCITGWHFPPALFRQLEKGVAADIFLLSHRPRAVLPVEVTRVVAPRRVLFEPNVGYDWGCYQQFLDTGIWRNYDYIFFMHDDMIIKNLGFIEAAQDLLGRGHSVIGNGPAFPPRPWPKTHPESYAHSVWKPPTANFCHDVVRGSFLATTREALEQIGSFEVYWDRWHLTIYFGNWSLRATCGKWQALLGDRCFGFLSDTWCESEFISEQYRGQETSRDVPTVESGAARVVVADWVYRLARASMSRYWDADVSFVRRRWDKFARRMIQWVAGRG